MNTRKTNWWWQKNMPKLIKNLPEKVIVTLLMISYPAMAESYLPNECTVDMNCTCYVPNDLAKIAAEMKRTRHCETELKMANESIKNFMNDGTPEIEWWQQPAFVIGGVVVGISVGTLVGVFVSK